MITVVIAGGFDPIHSGHIDHIIKAKQLGDNLFVILQNENNLIKKKGYCLLPYKDRLAVLSSVRFVDRVFANIDSDGTCARTIKAMAENGFKPDIFAKGGDPVPSNMPPNEIVICRQLGIEIAFGCGDLLNSSSNMVERTLQKISSWGGK
jgi:cytidyltransferase-like protein